MGAAKLTETGRRPLRKYGTELRDLATNIVNRLDEMREDEDTGGDMIGSVENAIWNALFGYEATIPVDKRIAGLQRDLAEVEAMLREIQWAPDDSISTCPLCGAWQENGHMPYCRLGPLLARLDARKAAQ